MTDASALGLGAVLLQQDEDGKVHPVAYASRSLSPSEKQYAITELETLAVVWSVSHFHAYLYGHNVQVFTDHSAVKAVLGTPSPSGKHACWWSKIFGSGVRNIQITYQAWRENANADALSRCPIRGERSDTSDIDVQVAQVCTTDVDLVELLQSSPALLHLTHQLITLVSRRRIWRLWSCSSFCLKDSYQMIHSRPVKLQCKSHHLPY